MNTKIKYIYIAHFKTSIRLALLPALLGDIKDLSINFGTKYYNNLKHAVNIINLYKNE